MAVVTPSVLVMVRSALGVSVSVSVALLFAGTGSMVSPGVVTVAVLESEPLAAAEIEALTVKVTEPPTGKLTLSLMFPDPAEVTVPPPAPTAVQVPVRDAGKMSATVAPTTGSGPALEAVMV